jgi:hypothetical protein
VKSLPFIFSAFLLAGCTVNPDVVRLSGAETRSETDSPKIVPAGFSVERTGTRMTLVTSEGVTLTGLLSEKQQPVAVRIANTSDPLVGGQRELSGQIAGGAISLDCRLQLLNPPLGITGGGTGNCQGAGRRVDFLY